MYSHAASAVCRRYARCIGPPRAPLCRFVANFAMWARLQKPMHVSGTMLACRVVASTMPRSAASGLPMTARCFGGVSLEWLSNASSEISQALSGPQHVLLFALTCYGARKVWQVAHDGPGIATVALAGGSQLSRFSKGRVTGKETRLFGPIVDFLHCDTRIQLEAVLQRPVARSCILVAGPRGAGKTTAVDQVTSGRTDVVKVNLKAIWSPEDMLNVFETQLGVLPASRIDDVITRWKGLSSEGRSMARFQRVLDGIERAAEKYRLEHNGSTPIIVIDDLEQVSSPSVGRMVRLLIGRLVWWANTNTLRPVLVASDASTIKEALARENANVYQLNCDELGHGEAERYVAEVINLELGGAPLPPADVVNCFGARIGDLYRLMDLLQQVPMAQGSSNTPLDLKGLEAHEVARLSRLVRDLVMHLGSDGDRIAMYEQLHAMSSMEGGAPFDAMSVQQLRLLRLLREANLCVQDEGGALVRPASPCVSKAFATVARSAAHVRHLL